MSDFETMRWHYIRLSFMQAKAEGKLPQWFMKQGLFFLLRAIISLLLIVPLKLIWSFTGRNCDGMAHVIKFCIGAFFYFLILWALICAPFMGSSSVAQ